MAEYGLDKPQARIAVDYTDTDGNAKNYELFISKNGPVGEDADKAPAMYILGTDRPFTSFGKAIWTAFSS